MSCEHKNMKSLHENTGNSICLDCKQHWYMGKEYTRKEWDLFADGWISKEDLMPKPDNREIEVLCSDGKARNAYAAEIGGFMVNATSDFAQGCIGHYEVTHWRDKF